MAFQMTVLLEPKLTIKRASLKEHRVWTNINDLALFKDQNLITVG